MTIMACPNQRKYNDLILNNRKKKIGSCQQQSCSEFFDMRCNVSMMYSTKGLIYKVNIYKITQSDLYSCQHVNI